MAFSQAFVSCGTTEATAEARIDSKDKPSRENKFDSVMRSSSAAV